MLVLPGVFSIQFCDHECLLRDYGPNLAKKKKKLADKILPQKVRDLVPESQAYMDLLAFERKLDATIMRKRLDIQVLPLFPTFPG